MKYLSFSIASLFIISACNPSDKFASLTGNESIDQKSEAPLPKTPKPEYERDLKNLVRTEVKVTIKDKKTSHVKVEETVGGKDFRGQKAGAGKKVITTNVNVESVILEESEPAPSPKQAKPKVQTDKKAPKTASRQKPLKKIDILWYIQDRELECLQRVRHFSEQKGLLSRLDHLDWSMSFAYYSQGQTGLTALETGNGLVHTKGGFFSQDPDYVLSRGEYSSKVTENLFNMTLKDVRLFPLDDHEPPAEIGAKNSNGWIEDPLSGLDKILSGGAEAFRRPGTPLIVLFFDHDFPYYSSGKWKKILTKHKNVSFVAASSRLANVSNFHHVLEKRGYDFNFCPVCETKDSPANLVKVFSQKAR